MSERRAYDDRIRGLHLAPLWEVLSTLGPASPRSPAAPAHWPYAALRGAVLEAGRIITATEAERRVLILENPGLPGQACITPVAVRGAPADHARQQHSTIDQVIWSVAECLAQLSSYEPLEPGDLLMTGTLEGVGAVERGDGMRGSIARLGEITVNVAR